MISRATPEALEVEGPMATYAEIFARFMGYELDREYFMPRLQEGVRNGSSVVFFAFDDGKMTGSIAGSLVTNPFNGELYATEIVWGSAEVGVGRKLRDRLKEWAVEKGAKRLRMGITETPYAERAERSLRMDGFKLQESRWEIEL